MNASEADLPCPPLTISIDVEPSNSGTFAAFAAIPAKSGVFALQSDENRTIALFTTANLRRAIESRLHPPTANTPATRAVNHRELTRRVRACTVGSAFEADWAYLQWARQLVPHSYRAMLDRWQTWFVCCDRSDVHPQFVKSAHPNRLAAHVALGPFPEKHAAGKYLEILEDAFDLCRYHHILVQAPHAAACAYKEMGRCPAPCDGSIALDEYRRQFDRAIEFGSTPIAKWRTQLEREVKAASAALDFESAQRHQRVLDATKHATRAEFAFVNRLERFKFAAVAASERSDFVRLFVICGGLIEPLLDLEADASAAAFELAAQSIVDRLNKTQPCTSEAGMENIGMVCWHLFRPRAAKRKVGFLRFNDEFCSGALQHAVKKLARRSPLRDEAPALEQGLGEV